MNTDIEVKSPLPITVRHFQYDICTAIDIRDCGAEQDRTTKNT